MSTTEPITLKTTVFEIIRVCGGQATVANIHARLHKLGQPKSLRRVRDVLYCALAEGLVSRDGSNWHYPRAPAEQRMAATRSELALAPDDRIVRWLFSRTGGVSWQDVAEVDWGKGVTKPALRRAWERVTADGRAVLGEDGRWRMPNAIDPEVIQEDAGEIFRQMRDKLAYVRGRLKAAGLARQDPALFRRVVDEIRSFDWTRSASRALGSLVVLARGWNQCANGGEMDDRFERQVDDLVSGEPEGMHYLDVWEWLDMAAAIVSPPPSVGAADRTPALHALSGSDEPACLPPPAMAGNP